MSPLPIGRMRLKSRKPRPPPEFFRRKVAERMAWTEESEERCGFRVRFSGECVSVAFSRASNDKRLKLGQLSVLLIELVEFLFVEFEYVSSPSEYSRR